MLPSVENQKFEAIVLAVAHRDFEKLDLEELKNNAAVVYDVKGFLKEGADGRL